MLRRIRTILHPAWYQGYWRKPPYFEGWYFKLVDADEQNRHAIIPGVFRSEEGEGSHAFVQVLDGNTGTATYHEYPVEQFAAEVDAFDLRIGPNRFRSDGLTLDIQTADCTVVGNVRFGPLKEWPVTLRSPGIMGWYGWIPVMECYHGVLSLDHALSGQLVVDGKPIDFEAGRGYIEKDWGRSFPSAWIWMQSNHFDQPGVCITASVAMIPWQRTSFRGFIAGLWCDGELYRFATYSGARLERLQVQGEQVLWTMSDGRHRLEIEAHRRHAGLLRGPSGVDMGVRVPETLQAELHVRLWAIKSNGLLLLFEGTGRNGGLEIVGAIDDLLSAS